MNLRKAIERVFQSPLSQQIHLTEDGFTLLEGGRPLLTASWVGIRSVAVFKRDLITTDLVCFELAVDPDGELWLVNEDIPGFADLAAALARHLPGFVATWHEDVVKPAFAPNHQVLFQR